jgi:hypothetical protein
MPSFEHMSGTRYTNRFTGAMRAAAPSINMTLLEVAFKKRRWESNPLGTALQAAASPSGSSAMGVGRLTNGRRVFAHSSLKVVVAIGAIKTGPIAGSRRGTADGCRTGTGPVGPASPRAAFRRGPRARRASPSFQRDSRDVVCSWVRKKESSFRCSWRHMAHLRWSEILSQSASSPGIEPGLQPSQSCVLIRHTPSTKSSPLSLSVPSRGVEPRLRRSKRRVLSVTLTGRILGDEPHGSLRSEIVRPAEGIEPPWGCLQNSCITVLPRWQFQLSRPARI